MGSAGSNLEKTISSGKVVPLNPSSRSGYGEHGSTHDITSPRWQVEVFRHLSRAWRAELSNAEYSLLSFFVDETIGWGQRNRKLTIRQIEEGNIRTVGTQMGRTQIKAHVKKLQDKGFITVDDDKSTGLRVTVVLPWECEDKLPIPKRQQNKVAETAQEEGFNPVEKPTIPGRKPGHPPVGKPTTIIEEYLEEVSERKISCGPADAGRESLDDLSDEKSPEEKTNFPALGSIRKRNRPAPQNFETGFNSETEVVFSDQLDTKREFPVRTRTRPTPEALKADRERREGARRTKNNPGAVEETFREAFAKHFSEVEGVRCHKLTKVELGKLKRGLCKDWGGEAEQLHAFVEFAAENWTQLVTEIFKWMTKRPAPVAPDILFLNWQRKEFIQAWNQRARRTWLDGIESGDRRKYHVLTKVRGMQHEAALLEIAKDNAVRQTREETEAKLAEAQRHHGTARILEERAKKAQCFNADNPHPKSPIAREAEALRQENERLKRGLEAARRDGADGLQPGASFADFVAPEWKDD